MHASVSLGSCEQQACPLCSCAEAPRPRALTLVGALLLPPEEAAQDDVHRAHALVRAPPQRLGQVLQVPVNVQLQEPLRISHWRLDDVYQSLWGRRDETGDETLFAGRRRAQQGHAERETSAEPGDGLQDSKHSSRRDGA